MCFRLSRRSSFTPTGAGRWILTAWMIYGLVNAPLPVIHQHAGPIEGATWSGSLGEHLHRFHPADAQHAWCALHVHWVPASDWAADEGDGSPDSARHPAPVDDDVLVAGPFSPVSVGALDGIPADHGDGAAAVLSGLPTAPVTHDEILPRQFLDYRPSALTVRAWLCVARC